MIRLEKLTKSLVLTDVQNRCKSVYTSIWRKSVAYMYSKTEALRREHSNYNIIQVHFLVTTISVLSLSVLFSGCGGTIAGNSATAPVVSISATAALITKGNSVTLTVRATNANRVTVTGTDGSSYTLSASGGTQAVSPTATTTYTVSATGSGGVTQATVTVTVTTAENTAPTITIIPSPLSIMLGGSSTLTVAATNATQVTVTGTDGSSYTLSESGGMQVVTPTITTTYTATAIGTSGNVTASAIVAVVSNPPSTITITASPSSITLGSSSTLTVVATNATQVTITGTDGSSYVLPASGGDQTVKPTQTTTYTATSTGIGGDATASAIVTVVANPTSSVTITASPNSIAPGSSSTLSVTATNATQVSLSGSDGSSYSLPASGGTQIVTPTVTTTYTASSVGTGGNATASATVTVTSNPASTIAIIANPTSVTSGSSSTLTVTATNATKVTLTGSDGSSYSLSANGGTQAVTPTVTTTYSAVAIGSGGNATASATVTVTPNPASTVTITANPTSITSGKSSTLTVAATNATQVTITGSDGTSFTLSASGGTQIVSPTKTTTYTVASTGTNGNASASTTVTVTSVPASTITISASPESITLGSSSTLTVAATNATQVIVTGTDGNLYTMSSSGGTQQVSPTATSTYTANATGAGGNSSASASVTVTPIPAPTITITANPTSITTGSSSTLTVAAANATTVTVTGNNGSSYTLLATGGTQIVSPTATTIYSATATGNGGSTSTNVTVTVIAAGSLQSINHIIFMEQENHTFDNYFGMLNPYRKLHGWNIGDDGKDYEVDGIDDKLTTIRNFDDEGTSYSLFKLKSTCVDDETSAWLASYGEVNRWDFLDTRKILMDGFVHNAEGFAKSCAGGGCSGTFTDLNGKRSMGYYDQDIFNYYYYMASQFAVSDRWFSPVSTKSVGNRIATFSGGTTQGLVNDPGGDDKLQTQLSIPTIFQQLDDAKPPVSWKIYYTVTQGYCLNPDYCPSTASAQYPATFFSNFSYSYKYLYQKSSGVACISPTQSSSVVGDTTNSFCIDPSHIAPLSAYFTDLTNSTLPSFAFIEAGYGNNDEHPGSGQSVLLGQTQVANIVNSLMTSPEWKDTAFFLTYDEGGGPYDHVPPVPGHSNDNTATSLGTIPDISTIAVNPDEYGPCVPSGGTPTIHCDLASDYPGAHTGDAAALQGFAAQLGFRLPNIIISPFTRKHYVSHTPMDHTAVIKLVENRFISSTAHLTARDAVQPNLLEFFDFTNVPWSSPPSPPTPVTAQSLGRDPCTPANMGP